VNKPIKPTRYARKEIIRKIIQGEWPPGTLIPSERKLSEKLGVTRATLREVLKIIEKEGWIRIKHGKSSLVKDFWSEGGLGILSGLNENKDLFPQPLIVELLEVRVDLLPICAKKAYETNLENFKDIFLSPFPDENSTAEEMTYFDWKLQDQIVSLSQNTVYRLVYNEFKPLFLYFGKEYFKLKKARISSVNFYKNLKESIFEDKLPPYNVVETSMKESLFIWNELSSTINGEKNGK